MSAVVDGGRDAFVCRSKYSVAAVGRARLRVEGPLSGGDGKAAMKNRDSVASRMAAVKIWKAQEMARRCQRSQIKECG